MGDGCWCVWFMVSVVDGAHECMCVLVCMWDCNSEKGRVCV